MCENLLYGTHSYWTSRYLYVPGHGSGKTSGPAMTAHWVRLLHLREKIENDIYIWRQIEQGYLFSTFNIHLTLGIWTVCTHSICTIKVKWALKYHFHQMIEKRHFYSTISMKLKDSKYGLPKEPRNTCCCSNVNHM